MVDLTGQRFGALTVDVFEGKGDRSRNHHTYWECSCDCGKKTIARGDQLTGEKTRSCGCGSIQAQFKSGSKSKFWKGDSVGIRAAHTWLRKQYPVKNICSCCNGAGYTEYAFIGPNGEHSRNIEDYIELCKSCHKSYDNCKSLIR